MLLSGRAGFELIQRAGLAVVHDLRLFVEAAADAVAAKFADDREAVLFCMALDGGTKLTEAVGEFFGKLEENMRARRLSRGAPGRRS